MAGAERCGRAHRTGHRVRDVVQLEVEEHRQARRRHLRTPSGPLAIEELEPELDAADRSRQRAAQRERTREVRAVDGAEDRVGSWS